MSAPSAERRDASAAARRFVDVLTSLDPHSPAFADHAAQLQATGRAELRQSADLSERAGGRWAGGAAGTTSVLAALRTTRSTLADLEPRRRGLGRLFGRSEPELAPDRLVGARPGIETALRALTAAVDALRRDIADARTDAAGLEESGARLHERADALAAVDERLTDAQRSGAASLDEALLLARSRRQELLTQEAVCAQAALAAQTVAANAAALVDAADRARRVTAGVLSAADAADRIGALSAALEGVDAALGAAERGR